MGAQKSIHAGKAKIDINVDFTHKLCAYLMLPTLSLCIKHLDLFGGSEKLDVSWYKGLHDSNILVAYRRPRPEWLARQSLFILGTRVYMIQTSWLPIEGHDQSGLLGSLCLYCILFHPKLESMVPVDNFSHSGSGGVNLSQLSVRSDLNEPASSKWSSTTSLKFEHVRPVNDDRRAISRDYDGFPLTCSGNPHDSLAVLKQESRFAKFCIQIEQGILVLSKWLIFNRFKFVAAKGVKLGPAFLLTSLTGDSIVGDMAPYQAFAIGGVGSVRGYGEGAVGS